MGIENKKIIESGLELSFLVISLTQLVISINVVLYRNDYCSYVGFMNYKSYPYCYPIGSSEGDNVEDQPINGSLMWVNNIIIICLSFSNFLISLFRCIRFFKYDKFSNI